MVGVGCRVSGVRSGGRGSGAERSTLDTTSASEVVDACVHDEVEVL